MSRVAVPMAALLMALGLIGCQSTPSEKPAATAPPPIVQPILTWDIGESRHLSPATIKAVAIEGDRLKLTVTYQGTGKFHDIRLLRHRGFMESSPPQIDLYLTHSTNDTAERPMEEVVHFDLAPLKASCLAQYKDAKSLVLRIRDTKNDDIFVPLPRYSF